MPDLRQSEPEQIRTLYVTGLPKDVKAREIHNLFCRRPAFQFCQLEYTGHGDQVVAFVTFFNHHAAVEAMNQLDGSVFDPETEATLHIKLARSNSRKRRPSWGAAYTIVDKRVKVDEDKHNTSGSDGDGGSDSDNDTSGSKGPSHANESGEIAKNKDDAQAAKNENQQKPPSDELQPCSTLFITSLGPNCTEEELKEILSQFSGFQTLKMHGKRGPPLAFADFTDVECSKEAMKRLHGVKLASSDTDGIQVQYARSKMRKT